jgi:hypothetical protein
MVSWFAVEVFTCAEQILCLSSMTVDPELSPSSWLSIDVIQTCWKKGFALFPLLPLI